MLKRTLALCMMLLLCAAIVLPFVDSNAHGVRQNSQVGGRRHQRHRSKAWWRRYRARLRQKRAAAALAHRNRMLTLPPNINFAALTKLPVVVQPAMPAPTFKNVGMANIPAAVNVQVPTAPILQNVAVPVMPNVSLPMVNTASALPNLSGPALPKYSARAMKNSGPIMPNVAVPVVPSLSTPAVPSVADQPPVKTVASVPTASAHVITRLPVLTSRSYGLTTLPTLTNTPVPPAMSTAPAPVLPSNARAPKAVAREATLEKNPVSPLPGQLSISVVALARPNPAFLTTREQSRMLSGIPVADLRRIVIDKMVVAGGWVTNDFVREVNGARVFVVTAHTPKDAHSPAKVWTFYFTESAGRIYSLASDAPVEHADRMSKEAERFIVSLQSATSENK